MIGVTGPPKNVVPIQDFGATLEKYIEKAAPLTFERVLGYFNEKTCKKPDFSKMPMGMSKKSSGKVYDYDEEGKKLIAKANL